MSARSAAMTPCAAGSGNAPGPADGPNTAWAGLRPGSPTAAAGTRIDPPPSLAWASGTMPRATATADPAEEPPVVIRASTGLTGPGPPPTSPGSV